MTESPEYRAVIHEAQAKARRIFMAKVWWLVYELPPPVLDRRTAPSLIFQNDYVIRRVRNFPIDWRILTEDELFELSWKV